ncbi:MAG: methylmalonyl Co-A mutase-associated GTPase MeaB [Pseudomonadota bacterium]
MALSTDRIERLAEAVRAGSRRAIGRALTLSENGGEDGRALLSALRPSTGNAHVIGITGPPGAGKSTLVDAMIHIWRSADIPVAVVAVDPVSPISGGAVLGDRTRMGAHSLDDGVFIRSVSARGHLGGLCVAAHDMVDVLDAAGWPLIVLETVGAGQSETEVALVADLSIVVSAPGLGDELQAIKSGILEIADVLVVNKADREDASQTANQLEGMLALRAGEHRDVPVLKVSATTGVGVPGLAAVLDGKISEGKPSRAEKRRAHLAAIATQELAKRLCAGMPEDNLRDLSSGDWDGVLRSALTALSKDGRQS